MYESQILIRISNGLRSGRYSQFSQLSQSSIFAILATFARVNVWGICEYRGRFSRTKFWVHVHHRKTAAHSQLPPASPFCFTHVFESKWHSAPHKVHFFESIQIPRYYATDSIVDTITFMDCVCRELMDTPLKSTFSRFNPFTIDHRLSGSPSLQISKQSGAIENPDRAEKEREDPDENWLNNWTYVSILSILID